MRYAMMICVDEKAAAAETTSATASDAGMAEVYAWFEKWAGAGKIADGGAELESVSTARTIRGAGNERTVTDGPFIETKESIGGFVILETESLDEALDVASSWPGLSSPSVCVEVRPTVDHAGMVLEERTK
jgi:hypothetical protein